MEDKQVSEPALPIEVEGKYLRRMIEDLSPALAARDRENQTAASLNDDLTFIQLKSDAYDQYSVHDLWQVACLFAGINPQHLCAKKVWIEQNQRYITGDAGMAVKNLFKLYKLAVHERIGTDGNARLGEFEQWARKEGLPPSAMFANALRTESAPGGETLLATDDKAQVTPAQSAEREQQVKTEETVGTTDDVEDAKDKSLPEGQGLLTKEIAHAFDGVNEWPAERWTKNLSASNWLRPARIFRGGAGGASSVWNPLMLAQLMHGKTKDGKAREVLMRSLNSRFTLNPALRPWRDAFNEYFATYCTKD